LPCYNFRMPFWKWVDVSLEVFMDVTKRAVLHPTTFDCTCRSSRYKINCKSQWHLVIRDNRGRLHRNMDSTFCVHVEKQVNNKVKSLLCSQKCVITSWYEFHPRWGLSNAVLLHGSHTKILYVCPAYRATHSAGEIIDFESPSLLNLNRI